MNSKTTLGLALILVACLCLLYVVKQEPGAGTEAEKKPARISQTTRDLIEDAPTSWTGVRVEKGGQTLVFEKSEETENKWHMREPYDMPVVAWEVEEFERQVGNITYDIRYEPGAPGAPTAEQAGLAPPKATVTLTSADGEDYAVEIGGPASENETYVRLAGSEDIVVAKTPLRGVFKESAIAYRDKLLWQFDETDATRIEITDRREPQPKDYVFVRTGTTWRMKSPADARATAKVAEALRAVARLRVTDWYEATTGLSAYGLEPADLTFRVTVEKASEPADDAEAEDGTDAPPAPVVETYELHVSSRSPIGQDTKVYVRGGDIPAVGAMMKTAAEKLYPTLSEWRDMRLTDRDLTAASAINLRIADRNIDLEKSGGVWRLAGGKAASEDAIEEMLTELGGLTAVAFVDASELEGGASLDFIDLRIDLEGSDQPFLLAVGDFTDAATKRLRYARVGTSSQVAKLKASDIERIITTRTFRDLTILDVPASKINAITLTLAAPDSQPSVPLVFTNDGETWKMTAPVEANVDETAMARFVEALAGLRATGIASESAAAVAKLGPHQPAASIEVTFQPPEAGEEPQPQTAELLLTRHEGKVYAHHLVGGSEVFVVSSDLLEAAEAELRDTAVFSFDAVDVSAISITQPSGNFTFQRDGDEWRFAAEPDLPLDAAKVEQLVTRIGSLKAERFVYGEGRQPAGDASMKIVVRTGDEERSLSIYGQSANIVATASETGGAFLLTPDAIDQCRVNLADLER